jgi:signal transduction histidine kinase
MASPMDNPVAHVFNDRERDLMAEVARRLTPKMGALARRWAEAIRLDAPAEKIPQMRQTLAGLTNEVLSGFFERLANRDPEGALSVYSRFIENLIRSQLDEPERQRATIEALFAAARAVRGPLAQEIGHAMGAEEGRVTYVLFCFSRLWGYAAESLGLIYTRLHEQHLRGLYDEAQRAADRLRESEERYRLLVGELTAARDAALESSRLKSAFLANMTHEVHTPLNIILGYADLMAERLGELGDEQHAREFGDPVRRSGNRLLETINAILEISKMEAGAYKLVPRDIRLADFAARLLAEFKVLAARKGLELSARIDAPGAVVKFDENCLSNALTNLLQNAIKFTERGTVSVRVYRDSTGVDCLEVADSGVGIDAAYVPHVFEPFSQENTGLTRKFEGVGLGLALVRKYLELNGARITVASEKGMGSIFTIRFLSGAALSEI